MQNRGRLFVGLLCGLLALGAGYLYWQGEPQLPENNQQAEFPTIEGAATPVSNTTTQQLKVTFKKGDVFPLMKTVTQTVTQKTSNGPVTSEITLQILLAIHVQDVQKERTKLRVNYQHVRFSHQFSQKSLGEQILYDSKTTAAHNVPPAAQFYHGLANNGFEFWIGPNHKVLETVQFSEFLKRCVQYVPPKEREAVMTQFIATTGDHIIANFIDDSLGLLPAQTKKVRVGDHWIRKQIVDRPVPLSLESRCTLQKLNDDIAEIRIDGKVIPSAAFGRPNQSNGNGIQLSIIGGHITGSCQIRRKTGLPERSEIHRVFDMLARFPNGQEVKQTNESKTVIEIFSPQGTAKQIAMPPIPPRNRQ